MTKATTTGTGGAPIPRTIWLLWWQGLEQAPALVKHCYRSWQHHNPGWDVVFLDETNYGDYADVGAILASDNDLKLQAKADVIRIQLLARHGGVWVDATCYCCRPLDEWLPEHAATGFFAFSKPAKNRLLDIWFLASAPGHPLTARLWEATESYWLRNRGLALRPSKTFFDRLLRTLLNSSVWATQFWLSYPVRRWLKAYPYMWPVFLFARLLRRDPRCAALWREVKKVSADVPHRLLRVGLGSPLDEQVRGEIDTCQSPLYKLKWRYDPAVRGGADYEGSVLQYVLEKPF